MAKAQTDPVLRENQLLDALEPAARNRIKIYMPPAELKLGAVVCEAGGVLQQAFSGGLRAVTIDGLKMRRPGRMRKYWPRGCFRPLRGYV